jgi:predicted nuclease of predicted toxin-antitoxin system
MVEETGEPLFIRLYLDEDVHKALVPALEARGFDAVGVHDLRHYGRSDAEHLAYAAAEGRAVFTFNAPDYIALHKRYLSEGRPHAGIIVSKQHSIRETIRRLLDLLNRVTGDEMKNQLWWV